MRLLYSNTLLCSSAAALGRVGPVGLTINRRQVNDVVAYIRASSVTVFPRGGRSTELGFLVAGDFPTLEAAQQHAALHFGELPEQADLVCTDEDDNALWSLPDACIAGLRTRQVGVSIFLEYAFTGGAFESEEVTLPPAGDLDIVKAKVVTLAAADVEKAVTYDAPFASAPRFVQATVSAPEGGGAIFAIPRESTRTAEGITFDLTAAVPATGYKLLVHAVL